MSGSMRSTTIRCPSPMGILKTVSFAYLQTICKSSRRSGISRRRRSGVSHGQIVLDTSWMSKLRRHGDDAKHGISSGGAQTSGCRSRHVGRFPLGVLAKMLRRAGASGPGGEASGGADERTPRTDWGANARAGRDGAHPTPDERQERFRILQAEVMARHEERLLCMAELAATKAERERRRKEDLERRIEAVRGAEGVKGGALKRLREEAERLRARRNEEDEVRTPVRDGRAAAVQDGAGPTDEECRAQFGVLQAKVMARHEERVLRMAELAARQAERNRKCIRAADTGAPRAEETRAAKDAQRRMAEDAERVRRATENARVQAAEAEKMRSAQEQAQEAELRRRAADEERVQAQEAERRRRAADEERVQAKEAERRRSAQERAQEAERRRRAAEEAQTPMDGRTPGQRLLETLGLLAEDAERKGRGTGPPRAVPA
jgi:hypothetical protein